MKRLLTSLLRSFSSAGAPKTRRSKMHRRPRFERLEERQVRAGVEIVELEIDGEEVDVLRIEGTNNNDHIAISYVDPEDPNDSDIRATIHDDNWNLLVDEVFASDEFEQIHAYGLDGEDYIYNGVHKQSLQRGGAGNDYLKGGPLDDMLLGGADNDRYSFRTTAMNGDDLGLDTISDEEGDDEFRFDNFGWGINLDLASNAEQTVSLGHLRIKLANPEGIEHVRGTEFDDVLRGNARDNLLGGYGGDDVLEGRGGDDYLMGIQDNDTYVFRTDRVLGTDTVSEWSGEDTFDFHGFGRGITLDIGWTAPQTPQIVSSGYLSIRLPDDDGTGIENVLGTNYDDTIYANSRDNSIWGNRGDDTIYGRAGNDMLDGGSDNDHLYGEGGFDRLYGRAGNDVLDGGFDGYADKLEGGGDRDFFAFYYEQYTDRGTGRVYSRPRADEQQIADPEKYDLIFAILVYSSGYGAPNW
jgi:Ca2+-binding RTX toxin-like protein